MSSIGSVSGSFAGQIQRQLSKMEASSAEARADALQKQADQAREDAKNYDRAAERAEVKASGARNSADLVKMKVSSMDAMDATVADLNSKFGRMFGTAATMDSPKGQNVDVFV